MTENKRTPVLRGSIFVKLLAVMLAMAVSLLLMVTGFFALVVYPGTIAVAERVFKEYARSIAASSPSFETAKNLGKPLGLQVRYDGPNENWSTSDNLPTIAEVQDGQTHSSFRREYDLEPAGNGTYLFAWDFGERVHAVHTKLLWLLLFLMLSTVLVAYALQKRLLRPVRALDSGVQRLSAGELDIVLPVRTRDEFGALTDAFNKMVLRVKQMIQARDQLLLDVSHELRSPLTRMRVALELLPDDEDRAGMAADLDEMDTMIRELLELERVGNPHGLRKAKEDFASILHEVARTFESQAPGVRVVAYPESILVDIDADKVRVLLRNLLENAFKYSLPDSKPVHLSARESCQTLIICVQDDGQGIPAAHIDDIFEPFFRIDPSRSKKTGGYGLGLSLCKRITESHGGTIKAENNPGRGASFIVTLPVAT